MFVFLFYYIFYYHVLHVKMYTLSNMQLSMKGILHWITGLVSELESSYKVLDHIIEVSQHGVNQGNRLNC